MTDRGWYQAWGKRAFDIVGSALAILAVAPVLGAVAILVRAAIGRPVIFAQERPGVQGRPFTLYKFRTMSDERDASGNLLPDEDRLGPVGALLRRWSLDELPELWNVLRGDMSLVGPRPLMMAYLDRYTPEQARRHEVKPGLTGLAQIRGRNQLTWEERFAIDVEYVDRHDFMMDLEILLKTVPVIAFGRGVAADGHATMPEYMGPDRDG